MARSYKRDANGRFAGGGGGGGGKAKGGKGGGKAKAGPKTTSARGRAKSRETAARAAVKAGGGSKATRSLLVAQRARDFYKATGTGTKRSPSRSSGGSKPAKGTATKAKPAKMSKAPANKAKQAYKEATSKVRELKMYRGGRTDSTVKNAAAKVKRMERSRGVSKPRKRKG